MKKQYLILGISLLFIILTFFVFWKSLFDSMSKEDLNYNFSTIESNEIKEYLTNNNCGDNIILNKENVDNCNNSYKIIKKTVEAFNLEDKSLCNELNNDNALKCKKEYNLILNKHKEYNIENIEDEELKGILINSSCNENLNTNKKLKSCNLIYTYYKNLFKAYKTDEIKVCEDFDNSPDSEILTIACKDEYIIKNAKNKKDCDEIVNDNAKKACLDMFDNVDMSNYDMIDNKAVPKNSTGTNLETEEVNSVINTAISSSNIKECDKIESEDISSFCKDQYYLTKSGEENNKEFCSKIKDKRAKQACLEEYVMNNLKKIYENQSKSPEDFCSVFKNEDYKKGCISSTKSYERKKK